MHLSVDELVETLQSNEAEQTKEEEDSRGKKSIALKSNDKSNDGSNDDMDNEKLALMIKKFNKLNK